MHRSILVLAILALSLAPAGLASAQQLAPQLPQKLTQPPPPPPAQPKKFDDGGLSTLQVVLIFGSATLVLGGIAFVIVRDARRRAPVGDRPRGASGSSGGGTRGGAGGSGAAGESAGAARARERQREKRAKAKAKAVRNQRKRNRPR